MEITYLSNSGFALEYTNELLVFDCHNPRKQPLLSNDSLRTKSCVTAFVSHVHGDHYSPDIFGMENASFVLSFDVPVPEAQQRCTVLSPGESTALNGLSIRAYGSTDEGVSFYVEWGDLALFHAGDLNDWHWKDESDEQYARRAEQLFLHELSRMERDIPQKKLFLAFFPVDPRMGADYYRGAILFAKALRPKYLMPMHFGREFNPPQAFFEQIVPFTELLTPPQMGRTIKIAI